MRQLFGNGDSYGRFGYAMANLGDINGDGLEGVCIVEMYSRCAL